MMIYPTDLEKKKPHPPTYPNFSDWVGSGETEIFLIMASVTDVWLARVQLYIC